MVLDILDTLAHPTRFDDFIVLSVDADFTPVLLRLREHDRRTAMLVSGPSAPALRAACDYAIPDGMFLDEALGLDPGSAAVEYPGELRAPDLGGPLESEYAELHQQMEAVVRQALLDSRRPLALAAVAGRVERALGNQVHLSRWAGAGSFKNFLAGIEDDHLVVDSAPPAGWLRDPGRHGPAPHGYPLGGAGVDLPEVAERICRVVGVPPLSPDEYATVFETIVEVGRPRSAEGQAPVERAVRDACAARERSVPRAAIHFVLLGYRYAGYDWTSSELGACDLAHAFADNTLTIAARAEMDLTEDDQQEVRRWITGAVVAPPHPVGPAAGPDLLLTPVTEGPCAGAAGAAG